MEKWKVLNSKKIIDNNWIAIEKHKCDIGQNKILNDYYIVKKKDYVILVIEDDGMIFLIKQYRHGIGKSILNLPMGFIDDGENSEMAAKRELIEETGYESDYLEQVGEFFPAPSYMTSKAYVFYTNKVKKNTNKSIDDNEGKISLVKVPKSKLKELLKNNIIKDMSTLTAILISKNKLDLF